MPYQDGFVPQYHYGHHMGTPNNNGQARPMQQQQQQQQQQPYHQRPVQTPQYFEQRPGSYYQPPDAATYPPPQPYLSPPPPPAQVLQYSPDPLHRYQPPPQPRQVVQTPQALRPQSSQHRSASASQWPENPWSPPIHESSTSNARSAAANAQVLAQPQRQCQQPPHAQSLQSHVSPGYAPSPSEYRRPSPVQPRMPLQDQRQIRAPQQTAPHRRDSDQRPAQSSFSQPVQYRSMPQQAAPVMNAMWNQAATAMNPAMAQRQDPAVMTTRVQAPTVTTAHVQAPKRRRSNDGTFVPVCRSPDPGVATPRVQQFKQEPGSGQQDHFTQVRHLAPESSPLTELASSNMPTTPTPGISIDYQSALLALSDDYINAAYSLSGSLSGAEVSEELLDSYQSLLATGMGCLDSVLKNYRIADARKEARIRLRYASLLYEETENLTEAEECLSKGITLCERAHLIDLKYAMHHLTARVWFKSRKFKTAMKTAERLAAESEKLHLLHWVYAFYFLRVSFGLEISDNHYETVSLVRYLTAVSAVATRYSHVSVQILAFTLEALVHLRARTPDSVDLANRAIASARMHQLTPEMAAMPQVRILLDCTDVACSLVRFDRKLLETKLEAMHAQMDQNSADASWANSHGCALRIDLGHSKAWEAESDSGGIFQRASNGNISLAFSWLTKSQAYIVGYLVTGIASLDGSRANEALKYLDQALISSKLDLKDMPLSQSFASARRQIQISLRATARLYVAFAFCGTSKWDQAKKAMVAYQDLDLPLLEGAPSAATVTLATYLNALIKHALGELDPALELYRSSPLQVKLPGGAKGDTTPVDLIKVLAALNSVEILHLRGKHKEAELLLDWTEPYCRVIINSAGSEHGNKAMDSLLHILKAAESRRRGGLIIDTKSLLQKSVSAAQSINNNQLLMVIMGMMTELYFKNIVGQQAMSSGKSSRSTAMKSNNKLWLAIADKMCADTLELHGNKAQSEQIRQEAQHHMASLPEKVRDAFQDVKIK